MSDRTEARERLIALALERCLHTRYAGERAHGEWFWITGEILDEIQGIGEVLEVI